MATESKSTPRVLNRGTDAVGETKVIRDVEVESETFTTTLSNGRQVVLREMMAGDLLYLEKSLGNLGDTERSLKLIVRLSTSEGRVTYEDLQKLKMRDLKKVTDLLTQASGVDEDDEDEFPNE
jgi:hypothetical protein